MSLLLEALKKAELAKQGAKSDPAESSPAGESRVITREALPDITQPLEILANDLPSATAQPAEVAPATLTPGTPLELAPAEPRPLEDLLGTPAAAGTADFNSDTDREAEPMAAEPARAAARQVFEVKEMDYNPRRPFYITLGLLGLCAVGYGGYVWWQMQPRSMYNAAAVDAAKKAGPAPAANTEPLPVAQPAPAAAPTSPLNPAGPQNTSAPAAPTAASAQQGIPAPLSTPPAAAVATKGTPVPATPRTSTQTPVAAVSAPSAPAARQAARQEGGPAATPRAPRPAGARANGQERPQSATPISITPPSATVDPQTEQAYQAFQQGNFSAARDLYQRVLQREPANRDALLGLAAIDIRARDYEMAETRYLKLLEIDPRDPYALAGIVSLHGQTDPVQSESRLKTLIAAQPDVAHLHFALGNQFAAQNRWPEAQASYFKAYSLEPDNPDFAFNLAIGLDRLRQSRLALDYYQRALTLATTKSAGFDKALAAARIKELSRP